MSRTRRYAKSHKSVKHPVTTVAQWRAADGVPLFAPILKAGIRGSKTVGLLTQRHRDILDILFTYFEPLRTKDNTTAIAFTLGKVLRKLGVSPSNHAWLRDKLDDLSSHIIRRELSNGWVMNSHIVRRHLFNRNGPGYIVEFENEYMSLFDRDVHIHSQHLTDAIVAVSNPVVKALVRFALSQSNSLNVSLDAALCKCGVPMSRLSKQKQGKKRRAVTDQADMLQRTFGIEIRTMMNGEPGVFYSKHSAIWFENPMKSVTNGSGAPSRTLSTTAEPSSIAASTQCTTAASRAEPKSLPRPRAAQEQSSDVAPTARLWAAAPPARSSVEETPI